MTTWIRKVKNVFLKLLSTHDNKYIITQDGKRIIAKIFFTNYSRPTKSIGSFTLKTKSPTSWTRRTKL